MVHLPPSADDQRAHSRVPRRVLSENRDPGARRNRLAVAPADSRARSHVLRAQSRSLTHRPALEGRKQLRGQSPGRQRPGTTVESGVLRHERQSETHAQGGRLHSEPRPEASLGGDPRPGANEPSTDPRAKVTTIPESVPTLKSGNHDALQLTSPLPTPASAHPPPCARRRAAPPGRHGISAGRCPAHASASGAWWRTCRARTRGRAPAP